MIGAPLERRILDRFARPLRIVTGAAIVGFTGASTIDGIAAMVVAAHGPAIAWLCGALAALAIFLVELLTAEDSGLLFFYLLAFLPDSYFTYLWVDWLIGGVMRANHAKPASIYAVCFVLSIAGAYVGERLLFGKRRRKGKHNANGPTSDVRSTRATNDHGSL